MDVLVLLFQQFGVDVLVELLARLPQQLQVGFAESVQVGSHRLVEGTRAETSTHHQYGFLVGGEVEIFVRGGRFAL